MLAIGLEWIGRRALGAYAYAADLAALTYLAFSELFRFRDGRQLRRGTSSQVITRAGTQLPKVGAGGLLGNIIVVVVIRELGPLLTAFIVVGRSGTAVTTELGIMRVGQEAAALEHMGIRLMEFLVMPRLVGIIVSMLCLTLYFDAVAVLGGFMVAKVELTVP